ncbi:MAG: hypothetical protein C0596_06210 [Marinilabiliales bacterium]|nr:MAG: hypothetical protein C0596_06210 [Marinilabiliales bacterium]
MAKFIFTYNAQYDERNGQEIREAIITFLHQNGAKQIEQCLETTFVFMCIGKTTEQWYKLIKAQLDGNGNVLDNGTYLLSRIFYTEQNSFEVIHKCNPDLQDFVDVTIGNLEQ